jgi:hypothetical protein
VSISLDDDTDSTEQSDSEFDSELDPDVDMRVKHDVDAPGGVDLDGDVDMERDGDNDVKEDEQEEDQEEEDGDDGKEPRTIGQGEVVNTFADDADTMVNDQPIVLPEQGQEMREPLSQSPAPTPRPQTPEPRRRPPTPETHPLSGLEHFRLVTPQKARPAVSTFREAEAAGNTSNVDADQQLLLEAAGGDSLSDVPLPDVPLPDVALPDVALPETCPDRSVGEE